MKSSIVLLALILFSAPTLSCAQNSQNQQPAQPGTSPSQPKATKEQIEEIKKQNAKNEAQNALIKQANDALSAQKWQDAIAPLQQLIAADPANWQYYSGLGDAQFHLGQYEQAADAYQKGIQAAETSIAADAANPGADPTKKKAAEAHMLVSLGNADLKLHENKEAPATYTKATTIESNRALPYCTLCATLYNTGLAEDAVEPCKKAIAADPNRADAYFILASLLVAESKIDEKGNVIAPPGTAEALNKYLELAPNGPHAEDVKQMLIYIGARAASGAKSR